MDTEEKGSGQQQKQVAKGKEFAFKIYLAYDPPSPPSRPFALNASIFFLIGFGLSDSERAGPHDPALLSLLTSSGPLPLNLLAVSPREPALGSTNTGKHGVRFQQSSLASEAWAVSAVRLKPCPAVDADSLPLFSQHCRPTSLMPGASVQGVGGVGWTLGPLSY
ncbi:hypothetical protein QQF64_012305 [Cirrhinus molitorella]|uniref:Uncharacterized protein n=1 Tax=Cirrhinus molitorella TaxID=172907 RepID=A0ABR3LV30_9TELE